MFSAIARAAPARILSLSRPTICKAAVARTTLVRTKKTLATSSRNKDRGDDENDANIQALLDKEDLTFEDLESIQEGMDKEYNELVDQMKPVSGKPETPKLATSEAEMFGSESFLIHKQLDQVTTTSGQPSTPGSLKDELGPNFTEEQYASHIVHGRGIHPPYFHPQTHALPVATIHFRSHHPKLLSLFTHFSVHAASALGIPTSKVIGLPTQRSLWTVLRSPFIFKKSQENFERKVYKRCIKAYDADPEVVDRWFKYLMRHEMGGVGMRMVKWDRMPIGVGAKVYGQIQKELERIGAGDKGEIKKLGAQIVQEELKAAQGGGKASRRVITAKVSS
ncbi:ribosomal protein S10 [Moniliophthora roreri MCA 2997]|uniref:Small ribosomal subunit protein uS10m n=2 Tax=Moniliophthora roreri TaxID=221103 RepID=V2Y3X5_MONRO|nr:ribosomal protein S10 [Moniliophthora roreri MCA 2997]KAI3614001.1 ribosomal protein S10 [Moniliophthora roreri]